jgi:hypothetical protein
MLGGTTDGSAMSVTEGLDSFSKVAERVPPSGNLDGAQRALANPVGIGARAIASDDLDAWSIAQPGRDGC